LAPYWFLDAPSLLLAFFFDVTRSGVVVAPCSRNGGGLGGRGAFCDLHGRCAYPLAAQPNA
jgi:hypothetical protein